MAEIKMVVFDMAGTTVDEKNVVYKTVYNTIKKYTSKVTLDLVLDLGAGKEKHQAIKDVLDSLNLLSTVDSNQLFQEFKVSLDLAYQSLDVQAIEGVENMFKRLRDNKIILVLNTGYSSTVANQLLSKLEWEKGKHYDALITADDVQNGRPGPDMIHKAMELFDIKDSAQVLKAGDSAVDIQEGKNANCGITVGVLTGAQTREQLQTVNPDYILDSLANLDTVLKNI